jgi:hypothetical protein
MLAFMSMHCGFSHRKFHKLRWASTLNQKHLFVITSLSKTQFEYGVKFSMEIQNIPQYYGIYNYFSSHFPSLLCFRTSIVQAWGRSHSLTQMLCKYYVANSFEEQKKKKKKIWNWKKYDKKKRKIRKIGRIKWKKEREKNEKEIK